MIDQAFVEEFRQTVREAAAKLLAVADEDARRRPAPGKWSMKEIIGHLIDSAANNHARFVRGQIEEGLRFDGYDQEAWVRVQKYQERPWGDLVRLWQAYNDHLAWVMASGDRIAIARPRGNHTLDRIAWQAVEADEKTTLAYFMRDYAAHLRHHLRQVFDRLPH